MFDLCPKCGTGRMVGPRYSKDAYGHERLRYTCATCGYSSKTKTADAKEDRECARKFADWVNETKP